MVTDFFENEVHVGDECVFIEPNYNELKKRNGDKHNALRSNSGVYKSQRLCQNRFKKEQSNHCLQII